MAGKRRRDPATIASDGHDCPNVASPPAVHIKPGDWAIIGDRQWSRPDEWFLALVIWADDDSVVTEHQSLDGMHRYRSLFPIARVLGVGEYTALNQHRRECMAAVRHLQEQAQEAEQSLKASRAAFGAELDRIGALKLVRWPDDTGAGI